MPSPLHASIMRGTYGMRFQRIGEDGETHEIAVDEPMPVMGRIYVHPESVHILEPRRGDIVAIGEVDGWVQYKAWHENDRNVRCVVSRVGQPFFWPAREDA